MPTPAPEVAAERSNTATALLSASATKRRCPEGESASALGVLPSPVPPGTVSTSSVMTRAAFVSTTLTRSVLAEATKSREPSGLRSRAEGCRPTRMTGPVSSRELGLSIAGIRLNTRTSNPPHAET